MADTSPFERAVRALEDAFRHERPMLPTEVYRDAVRRVLSAIREPSEPVLGVLAALIDPNSDTTIGEAYEDIIDALLAEGE